MHTEAERPGARTSICTSRKCISQLSILVLIQWREDCSPQQKELGLGRRTTYHLYLKVCMRFQMHTVDKSLTNTISVNLLGLRTTYHLSQSVHEISDAHFEGVEEGRTHS